MRLVYIAGAYRNPLPSVIEQNIRAAEALAIKVHEAGMFAVATHPMTRYMDGFTSDEHMLAGTLELMRRCDAVLLVHNWRDSEGSLAEVAEAQRLGIPVFGLAQVSATDDGGALAGLVRWRDEKLVRRTSLGGVRWMEGP